MQEYFAKTHATMSTIDKTTMEFRLNTLLMIADAGIAINKLSKMRKRLEKMSKLRLTSTSEMRTLIPPLLQFEVEKLREEFKQKSVMIIFDGTTNVNDVFGIIFRYITDTFDIRHRVVAMEKYQQPLTYEILVAEILRQITDYSFVLGQISTMSRPSLRGDVVGFQQRGRDRDRISVNSSAVKMLLPIAVGSKDLECVSHTITNAGKAMKTIVLLKLAQDVCSLIKDSCGAGRHWFNHMGKEFKQPGQTSWWAMFQNVFSIMHKRFAEVLCCLQTFSDEPDNILQDNGARITRIRETVSNTVTVAILKLELESVISVCKPLMYATDLLEGNGPCAVVAWKVLTTIRRDFNFHIAALSFGGILDEIDACASVTSVPNNRTIQEEKENLKISVRAIITPIVEYYEDKIFNLMSKDVAVYEVLRWINPVSIIADGGLNADFALRFRNGIKGLNYFTADEVNNMIADLPRYIEKCHLEISDPTIYNETDYELQMNKTTLFWKKYCLNLTGIALLARYAFTIATSSASVERLFSVLKISFGKHQKTALQDYVQLSCTRQYNRDEDIVIQAVDSDSGNVSDSADDNESDEDGDSDIN